MSESSSKVESQVSFFGENAFTNLKMEGVKEFSEDEFSKEDEEMMDVKQLDEQSNDLVKNEINHEVNQSEIDRLGELDRLNNLSQQGDAPNSLQNLPIEQPNDPDYPVKADEPRNECERIAAPVNASSLLASKSPAEQAPSEPKQEPSKAADNQHLISSLNSLIQQSNPQQNNQFSQVGLCPNSLWRYYIILMILMPSEARVRKFCRSDGDFLVFEKNPLLFECKQ